MPVRFLAYFIWQRSLPVSIFKLQSERKTLMPNRHPFIGHLLGYLPEPRCIHRIPLFFLIVSQFICKGYSEFTKAGIAVRHVLRHEADARGNLSGLKNVIAIAVENGLAFCETIAQCDVDTA